MPRTIGAAWGLAHFSPGRLIAEGTEDAALRQLPVAALRLEAGQVENLKQFGLRQIGQLYERDRRALQARFGVSLLLRLDQALGWLEEKLVPRLPLAEHFVERRFAEPIGLIEDVLMTAHDLAITLSLRLEQEGAGAQSFHLFIYRVDHKVMTLSVNAARATRDPEHISRLFAYRSERLNGEYDAGFGIDMIRLAASSIGPLDIVQIGAFGSDDGAATLDGLYDRMSSRLGPLAVVRSKPVNTYIPEQVIKLEPAIAPSASLPDMPPMTALRPLRLLPQPSRSASSPKCPMRRRPGMIWRRVGYRFVKSSGPERLGAEWRQSAARLKLTADTVAKAALPDNTIRYFEEGEETRDYYIAEDDGGRRFWLFRLGLFGIAETPHWFLHGFFA